MYGADELLHWTIPCPTTPRIEFEFVMRRRECPPQQMVDGQGNTTRLIQPIEELEKKLLTEKAGLKREEIVAVVRRPRPDSPPSPPLLSSCRARRLALHPRWLLPRPILPV